MARATRRASVARASNWGVVTRTRPGSQGVAGRGSQVSRATPPPLRQAAARSPCRAAHQEAARPYALRVLAFRSPAALPSAGGAAASDDTRAGGASAAQAGGGAG